MSLTRLLSFLLVGAVALLIGALGAAARIDWLERGPERIVAALPGVGPGWLDTLTRIAGDVTIDTVNATELAHYGPTLLGLHEPFHHIVSVQTRLTNYMLFIRAGTCATGWGGYQHPLTVATPWGAVAHEFGHHYAFGTSDAGSERFADRFARAVLALRGWDDADPADKVLTHRVRYLLLKSYWPTEAQ